MNIFRTILTTQHGDFLIHATHEAGKIQSIKSYPIEQGIVKEALDYTLQDYAELMVKLEAVLETTI